MDRSRRQQAAAGAVLPVAERARGVRRTLHRPPDIRHRLLNREENRAMIKLHHGREGREIWVNADLIETLESTPDTVLKLTTDRRLIVTETPDEIVALVVEMKRRAQSRPHVISDR
jgi:flagellar protein FlbD